MPSLVSGPVKQDLGDRRIPGRTYMPEMALTESRLPPPGLRARS
jgi:hypothetical protein